MAKKPLEINPYYFGMQDDAKYIAWTWLMYNSQRRAVVDRWKELRNYIFATDTTTTTNKTLPWKNSTTLPKLCQIRDNLHSNYISALFPNDDWLKWEAYSLADGTKEKRTAIESYMANKARTSNFRGVMSQLLYDFIDYGNAFATVDFENRVFTKGDGSETIDYIGPVVKRISPLDIVFNPTAASFQDSFKIVRSVKTVGELMIMGQDSPDNQYLQTALNKRFEMIKYLKQYGIEMLDREEGFMMDGFGSYSTYLQSNYVEVLQFYGDLHNAQTGELRRNRCITIIDRMFVIDDCEIPSWLGHAPIYKTGWRTRQDNLWSMSPLENLVGMQYRIDHLENLKADAMDLAVLPPLVIQGEVEEFEWKPGAEIHIDENGGVTELARNVQWVIQADNAIAQLEQRMEMYAGAPREAMGIRTAGEKTAYEVQQLNNAAGRIFQEKVTTFEIELLEPTLNAMLETSARNLDQTDIIRVMDNSLGVQKFMEITKDDITASGKLRPIGARHFAAQAQLIQNLQGLSSSAIWQNIQPHLSSKALATLVEDVLGLNRFSLFSPNVAVMEQQETQRIINQASEDLHAEQSINPSTGVPGQPNPATQYEQTYAAKGEARDALRGMQ